MEFTRAEVAVLAKKHRYEGVGRRIKSEYRAQQLGGEVQQGVGVHGSIILPGHE
jgi:hypothetical protein